MDLIGELTVHCLRYEVYSLKTLPQVSQLHEVSVGLIALQPFFFFGERVFCSVVQRRQVHTMNSSYVHNINMSFFKGFIARFAAATWIEWIKQKIWVSVGSHI
jgi:hypothetical protein